MTPTHSDSKQSPKISVFMRSHKHHYNARFPHFERVCKSKPYRPSRALKTTVTQRHAMNTQQKALLSPALRTVIQNISYFSAGEEPCRAGRQAYSLTRGDTAKIFLFRPSTHYRYPCASNSLLAFRLKSLASKN